MNKTSRGKKAEATRAAILAATRKCIGTTGFAEASVSRIAEMAGVSKGVVYYYFRSKEDIAAEVLENAYSDLLGALEDASAKAPGSVAALRGMLDSFSGFLFDNREMVRFMLSELWRDERSWSERVSLRAESLIRLIETQLVRGLDEGVMREDMDVRFTAVAAIGTVLTASLYYLNEKTDETRERFTSNLQNHIAPSLMRK